MPSFFLADAGPSPLDQRREARARKDRRKRRIRLVMVPVVLAGAAYGGWSWWQGQQPEVVTYAPEDRWVEDNSSYTFALPTTPEQEMLTSETLGMQVQGTTWTIDEGDDLLLVVSTLRFPGDLGEGAQSSFDGMLGGMERRSGGTITKNEAFSEGDIERRTAIIEIDGGRIFVEGFAKGDLVLLVTGGVPFDSDTPPDTYQGIVDSVVLH